MEDQRQPFELRARKLYQEAEDNKLVPGANSTANLRQVRAMQDAVGKARAEGRLTVSDARAELAVLHAIKKRVEQSPAPVPVRLAAADREFGLRKKGQKSRRRRRKGGRSKGKNR